MKKERLTKQLALMEEVRRKIEQMKKGSAFVTDFGACALLERLLLEYQTVMSENIKLQERLKFHELITKKRRLKKKENE